MHHTHIAFCFIISPVYCVMLLANLNARAYIREGVSVVNFDSSGVSGLSLKDISYRNRRSVSFLRSYLPRLHLLNVLLLNSVKH